MAKEPEIPVLHVFHNNDIELYYAKVREDKVYLNNKKIAQFSNQGVFTIKDRRGKVTKKFKAVIALDGKMSTAEQDVGELETIPKSAAIFEALTDNDRKEIVKRELAKQRAQQKAIETWQFIVILAMLGALIAMQFLIR